eukprot:g1835.t1
MLNKRVTVINFLRRALDGEEDKEERSAEKKEKTPARRSKDWYLADMPPRFQSAPVTPAEGHINCVSETRSERGLFAEMRKKKKRSRDEFERSEGTAKEKEFQAEKESKENECARKVEESPPSLMLKKIIAPDSRRELFPSNIQGKFVKELQKPSAKGSITLFDMRGELAAVKRIHKERHQGWTFMKGLHETLAANPSRNCIVGDVDANDATMTITMPYIRGCDLFERVDRIGWLSRTEALDVFEAVSAGLAHIHALNYAHMDIALENVVLEMDPDRSSIRRVLLIDYDFCIPVDPETGRRHRELATSKQHGQYHPLLCGRAHYMPPELAFQLRADRERCDLRKVDVYSLGILFYIAWFGELPTMQTHLKLENPSLLPQSRRFPALLELIKAMLAKSPESRPNVNDVLRSLRSPSFNRCFRC